MTEQQCDLLREAGVNASSLTRPDICLNCPKPECVLDKEDSDLIMRRKKDKEVYLECECGATETLTMYGKTLEKHWRWIQLGDKIFHNCVFRECKVWRE